MTNMLLTPVHTQVRATRLPHVDEEVDAQTHAHFHTPAHTHSPVLTHVYAHVCTQVGTPKDGTPFILHISYRILVVAR